MDDIIDIFVRTIAPRPGPEFVVGNFIEPGGEFRLAAILPQASIGLEKSFLGQVVGTGIIAMQPAPKHISNHGLMTLHKFSKGVMISLDEHPGDEIGILQ